MEDVVRGLSLGMSDKSVLAASSPEVASSMGFTYGFMAVLLLFLLPSNLLFQLGIGYDVPDSFAAFKIHPATYLTAFGLVSTLLAVLQRKTVTGFAEWRVPIIFVLLTVLCAMCSFVSVGTAGASNYIDTFVAAGALAMILATGDFRQRRRLGYTIMALVLLNVILSFWESLCEIHLVPVHISTVDLAKWKEGNDFRPAGLYSHPLVAACVTSMGVWLLLSMRLGPWISGVLLALLAAGLFSFGGRAAMSITLGILVVAGVIFLLMKLVRRALTPLILGCTLLAVVLLPLLLVLLGSQTNIGNRIVTHFYVDDSAMVRAQQWDILDLLDLREVLFGTTRDRVDQMTATNRIACQQYWDREPMVVTIPQSRHHKSHTLPARVIDVPGLPGPLWRMAKRLDARRLVHCHRIDKQLTGCQDVGPELPCCLCICDERLQKSEGRHRQ